MARNSPDQGLPFHSTNVEDGLQKAEDTQKTTQMHQPKTTDSDDWRENMSRFSSHAADLRKIRDSLLQYSIPATSAGDEAGFGLIESLQALVDMGYDQALALRAVQYAFSKGHQPMITAAVQFCEQMKMAGVTDRNHLPVGRSHSFAGNQDAKTTVPRLLPQRRASFCQAMQPTECELDEEQELQCLEGVWQDGVESYRSRLSAVAIGSNGRPVRKQSSSDKVAIQARELPQQDQPLGYETTAYSRSQQSIQSPTITSDYGPSPTYSLNDAGSPAPAPEARASPLYVHTQSYSLALRHADQQLVSGMLPMPTSAVVHGDEGPKVAGLHKQALGKRHLRRRHQPWEQSEDSTDIDSDTEEVQTCSPHMFRVCMEQHINDIMKLHKDRQERQLQLEHEMDKIHLDKETRDKMTRALHEKESNYLRVKRAQTKMDRSQFEKISVLAIGLFGEVALVRKIYTKKLFAVKTLSKKALLKRNLVEQVQAHRHLLADLSNKWVVKLFYSFQDKKNLYFVKEYIPGGDMMSLLIKFGILPEDLARFYIAELVLAVESIHTIGFVHSNIKPDNILIRKDGHIKLTDFGLLTCFPPTHDSKYYQTVGQDGHQQQYTIDIDHEGWEKIKKQCSCPGGPNLKPQQRCLAHSLVSTLNYVAPEILAHQPYDKLVDWWSVGVILYEMIIGRPPFMASTPMEVQLKVLDWHTTRVIPRNSNVSSAADHLLRQLLCDSGDRLGKHINELKGHAFFEHINWESDPHEYAAPYVPTIKHSTDTSNFYPVQMLKQSYKASGDRSTGKEAIDKDSSDDLSQSNSDTSSKFSFHQFFQGVVCPISTTKKPVLEKDLPYTSVHIPSSAIGEEGGRLSAGGVVIFYPPGSLPVGAPIEAIVAELESGFRLDGKVALSPQVTLIPHGHLRFPVELTMPLNISNGHSVSVRKSETACTDPLEWKELPHADYSVQENCVVIKTSGNTIYQVLSGPGDLTKLEIVGHHIHFSVQQRPLGHQLGKEVSVLLSDDRNDCTMPKDGFLLASPAGAVDLRKPPGLDLEVTLKALKPNTITQSYSPYDPKNIISESLDESFYVAVVQSGSPEAKEDATPRVTTWCRCSPEAGSNLQDWTWLVQPAILESTCDQGLLIIQPGKIIDTTKEHHPSVKIHNINEMMAFQELSDPCKVMSFALYWMQSEVEYHPKDASRSQDKIAATSLPSSAKRNEHKETTSGCAGSSAEEMWRKVSIADATIRSQLVTGLCETSKPFSYAWKDIMRCLPAVMADGSSQEKCAFPGADNEIRCIQQSVCGNGSDRTDSECLRLTLNKWIDGDSGHATVGHLCDTLKQVGLIGAAQRFFLDFFKEPEG